MELFGKVNTVQELLDFLNDIPSGLRHKLPISIVIDATPDDEITKPGDIDLVAYQTYETEGCEELGFRITINASDVDVEE